LSARKPRDHVFYIKRSLREIWGWHDERNKAKRRAAICYVRGRETFRCEGCGKEPLKRDEVEIDHTEPVGSFDGDWTGYINRMFCPAEGLKILCKDTCHRAKTDAENAARRAKKRGK
jgi:hypothetical protein